MLTAINEFLELLAILRERVIVKATQSFEQFVWHDGRLLH
jgi:hypothetical protein